MTTNDRQSPQQPPPRRPGGRFFDSIRNARVYRPVGGRWVGGVSGAIAERTGLDRTLIRGLIVVVCLFFGIGVLLYGLAWLFLPEPDGRIHAEGVLHGAWTGGFIGSCIVVLFGLGNPGFHAPWFVLWPFHGSFWGWFGSLVVIGLIVALVVYAVNHRGGTSHGQPGEGQRSDGQWSDHAGQPAPRTRPDAGTAPASPAGPDAGTGAPRTRPDAGPPPSESVGSQADSVNEPGSADDEGEDAGETRADDVPTYATNATGATSAMPAAETRPAAVGYETPPAPPTPPTQPTAPAKPRMITKPAGVPMTLLVVGVALLGIAAGWLVDNVVGLPGDARMIAVGAGEAILGIGIVVAGAIGRRGGGLTGWAWCGIALAAIVAFLPMAGRVSPVHDGAWSPSTAAAAGHGYSVGIGTTTVDLSNVNAPASGKLTVPVNSGIGDVHLVLPADVPAKVEMSGGGSWDAGATSAPSQDAGTRTLRYGSGKPDIVVKVRMGIGDFTVTRQDVIS